jgi:hypothetical protein
MDAKVNLVYKDFKTFFNEQLALFQGKVEIIKARLYSHYHGLIK